MITKFDIGQKVWFMWGPVPSCKEVDKIIVDRDKRIKYEVDEDIYYENSLATTKDELKDMVFK